ncbi:UBR-type domain-containing protein [Entamoeba marina]
MSLNQKKSRSLFGKKSKQESQPGRESSSNSLQSSNESSKSSLKSSKETSKSSLKSSKETSKHSKEKSKLSTNFLEDYTNDFFEKLRINILSKEFMSSEDDLIDVEAFCVVLKDLLAKKSSYDEKFEMVRYITLISYHLSHSSFKWASLRSYFSLERVKKVVNIFIHFLLDFFALLNSQTTNDLIPHKDPFSIITLTFKLLLDINFVVDFETLIPKIQFKKVVPALTSSALETIQSIKTKEHKFLVNDVNTLDKQALKGLLTMDVTRNVGVEENEVFIYSKVVIEAQRSFIYEEYGITKYFEYLHFPFPKLVQQLKKSSQNNQKDVGIVLETVSDSIAFLMKVFPKFEPTCVGVVAKLLVDLTELHDSLALVNYHEHCEELVSLIYSVTLIIGENIGNIVVETNMQAYCAAHLFSTLLPSEFSLKDLIKNVNSNQTLDMPCLYPMAVALSFSREVFQKISSSSQYIVDETSFKNVSTSPLKLNLYNVEFDALALQTNVVLATIILSPNGQFLDTIFSLLLLSFLSVGYLEYQCKKSSSNFSTPVKVESKQPEKIDSKSPRKLKLDMSLRQSQTSNFITPRTSAFSSVHRQTTTRNLSNIRIGMSPRFSASKRTPQKQPIQETPDTTNKKETSTSTNDLVDYELTRSLPLYLSIFIFGESSSEELRNYVAKFFNANHLDVIIFLTSVESVSVPFMKNGNSPSGPLVKDKETIMNLRSLCSSLVNYNWLSEQLMGYLIRKQAKEYPVLVPVELLVFLARVWIVRINKRGMDEKEDMQAVNLWETLIKTLEKLLKTQEWEEGESIAHEYLLMMLFIFHSLSKETRTKFILKIFGLITTVPSSLSIAGKLTLARISMLLQYLLTHFNGMAPGLLEEVKRVLLSRWIQLEENENVELPRYLEYSNGLIKQLQESRTSKIPPYGYAQFYTITQDQTSMSLIERLRKTMTDKQDVVEFITNESCYEECYLKLMNVLKETKKANSPFEGVLREYLYHSITELLCILPLPNQLSMLFGKQKTFTTNGINDGLIVLGLWFNAYCYNLVTPPNGMESNANDLFKDILNVLSGVGEAMKQNSNIHCESIIKLFVDTIRCQCWSEKMVNEVVKEMEEKEKIEDSKEEAKVDEDLLVRKRVVVKKRESVDKSIDNKREREIFLNEMKSILDFITFEFPQVHEEPIQKEVKKTRILDNVPTLPIQSFANACVDVCVKKPQQLFDILTVFIKNIGNGLKESWSSLLTEKQIKNSYAQILVLMAHNSLPTESIAQLLFDLNFSDEATTTVLSIGDRKGFSITDVVHPFNYFMESVSYHPITCTSKGRIGGLQSTFEAISQLVIGVCERGNISGNYQQSSLMKEYLRLSGSSIIKSMFSVIEQVGDKLCGSLNAQPLIKQATMPFIDDFLESFLVKYQQEKVEFQLFIPIIRKFFDILKGIIADVVDQRIHGRVGGDLLYYKLKSYHREAKIQLYLTCAAKIPEGSVSDQLMEFLSELCDASSDLKDEIESAIEGSGRQLFSEWAVQKIVGFIDCDGVFRLAESSSTRKFFDFIKKIIKTSAVTGRASSAVVESLGKALPVVFENYPEYIGKYFKTITDFGLQLGDFSSILICCVEWMKKVIEKKETLSTNQLDGINNLLIEFQHVILLVPRPEKKIYEKTTLSDEQCTSFSYSDEYLQPSYHCYTCDTDICFTCLKSCHDGHDTTFNERGKKGNEEVVKDKIQQAVLRALNRDSTLPSVLLQFYRLITNSKECWKHVTSSTKQHILDSIYKLKTLPLYEDIGCGFEEHELYGKDWLLMSSSQNTRIIPLVNRGLMIQNGLTCDKTNLYHVRNGNELYSSKISDLIEQKDDIKTIEENISIEVPFEIVQTLSNNQREGVIAISGYRNANIIVFTTDEAKQIDLVMDTSEKDMYISNIKWINSDTLVVMTNFFVRVFNISPYFKSNNTVIEASIEYRLISGSIFSCVVTSGTSPTLFISSDEEVLYSTIIPKTLPTQLEIHKVEEPITLDCPAALYITRHIEKENLLVLCDENFNALLVRLDNEGKINSYISCELDNLPTYFCCTTDNTFISICQEMKNMMCYRLTTNGMNYLRLYNNQEVGGVCYDAETSSIFVALCDGPLVLLKETTEPDRIEKLKPFASSKQSLFQNLVKISPEKYNISEKSSCVITPDGRVTLYKTTLNAPQFAIRGMRVYVGGVPPKQLNFTNRCYPIGDGERWYDIQLGNKETLLSRPLQFSYISEPNDETRLEIEDIEVYGVYEDQFNFEDRIKIFHMKKSTTDAAKATNIAEEAVKTIVSMIGVIFAVTRPSRDRDSIKEELVKTLRNSISDQYKALSKACVDTLKSLSADDQSQQKVIETLKGINENIHKDNDENTWLYYIYYIHDVHITYPDAIAEYQKTNPRFVTNICSTILSQFNSPTLSLVSIVTRTIVKNMTISTDLKTHFKQHFDVIRTILLLPNDLAEVGVLSICDFFEDKKPRLSEIEYVIRVVIQESRILAVEKQLEVRGEEKKIEFVSNIRENQKATKQTLSLSSDRLQTVTETKEVELEKLIDERTPIEMPDTITSVLIGMLDCIVTLRTHPDQYCLICSIFYWVLTQQNYILKEDLVALIISKFTDFDVKDLQTDQMKSIVISLGVLAKIMASLDIDYYQQYTRTQLTKTLYSYREGQLPLPSITNARKFANAFVNSKKDIDQLLYELFDAQLKRIHDVISFEPIKSTLHRLPFSEKSDTLFTNLPLQICETILEIMFYIFNYNRDMKNTNKNSELWSDIVNKLTSDADFKFATYSAKRMLYQFSGGAYAYHMKTDEKEYIETIPILIQAINELLSESNDETIAAFSKNLTPVNKLALKRPNHFQRYLREDNELFILLTELVTTNKSNEVRTLTLRLLRCVFLTNVDRTIRERPIRYGISQFQTIQNERNAICEDLMSNITEQRTFLQPFCDDAPKMVGLITSIANENDSTTKNELNKFLKALSIIGTESHRNFLVSVLWKSAEQIKDMSQEIVEMLATVSFHKAKDEMKIDKSVEQYFD